MEPTQSTTSSSRKATLRENVSIWYSCLLVFMVSFPTCLFAQFNDNQSRLNDGQGQHTSRSLCKFRDVNDMIQQVNSRGIEYARSKGQSQQQYDSNRNGKLDGLERRFYASYELGSYKCSEFSALLACILQELFNCTPEQVRVIEGHVRPGLRHSINQLNTNMFHSPPARGDAQGWFNFEPQQFFGGGNAGGTNSINYNRVVYDKPQPYRSGINNTIYDELGCKSGPGYSDGGGGGGGLFGGAGGSLLLSQMIGSLMRNLNQDAITPVAQPSVETPPVSGTITTVMTPAATAVPTATATAVPTPTATISLFAPPQSTPVPQGNPQYIPTTAARSLDSMGKYGDSGGFFPDDNRSDKSEDYEDNVQDSQMTNEPRAMAGEIFPSQQGGLFPN